jgi:hypothetical protein
LFGSGCRASAYTRRSMLSTLNARTCVAAFAAPTATACFMDQRKNSARHCPHTSGRLSAHCLARGHGGEPLRRSRAKRRPCRCPRPPRAPPAEPWFPTRTARSRQNRHSASVGPRAHLVLRVEVAGEPVDELQNERLKQLPRHLHAVPAQPCQATCRRLAFSMCTARRSATGSTFL